jgi:FkbM family methyltransferase
MNISRCVRCFHELASVADMTTASVLTLAHLSQKIFPVLGAHLRNNVWVLDAACCSRPISLRLATSDYSVFRQIFIYQEYAPLAGIRNVRTIVDCGANIGLASMYLLDRYPSATLLAMEPDTDNAEMCRRNLSAFGDRVRVETTGIWTHGDWGLPARLRLERSGGDHRDWAITVREAGVEEEAETTGVSMEAICERAGEIDLLKIDIEGTEELIFGGNSASWLARVRNIAIELHNEKCRDAFRRALDGFEFESFHARETLFIKNLRVAGKTASSQPARSQAQSLQVIQA